MENKGLSNKPKYKGIGGWLILIMIGLIIRFIYSTLYTLVILTYTLPKYWSYLIKPDYTLWATGFIIASVDSILLVIVPIILLVLMFKKSRLFPKVMIIWLISEAVLGLLITVFEISIYSNITGYDLFRYSIPIISAVILVPYFHVSKRVKATFLNVNTENKEGTTTDTTLPD
ncbi:DUF2569 family protein [Gottfriedia acidiceleris]|uniref:DUF2569 family protein n=1 Tax=Gottfriedia acidiceleris TaxID=371036 RepID=UPI00101B7987|nr:DUF2569 family protein [Gottfriedia acidiceleris]